MKKLVAIVSILLIIGVALIFLINKTSEREKPNDLEGTSYTFPQDPITYSEQPLPNQKEAEGTQEEVAQDFKGQINNKDLITVYGTTIVGFYALQTWGDTNKGGEALLVYRPSEGWVLLSMGGGAWGMDGLVEMGVPRDIAGQLIAGRKY